MAQSRKRRAPLRTSQTLQPPPPIPVVPPPSKGAEFSALRLFLLVAGILMIVTHHLRPGLMVLGLAAVLQFLPSLWRSLIKTYSDPSGVVGRIVLLLLLAWVSLSLILLTFPNYSWQFPLASQFPFQESYYGLAILALAMVVLFRFIPSPGPEKDISPSASRIGLLVILAVAAFMRFHHPEIPVGPYWEDFSSDIVDARRILGLEDFRNAFVFNFGGRQPFSCYFNIFTWLWMPNASALFVQRLGGTLIELGGILFLYAGVVVPIVGLGRSDGFGQFLPDHEDVVLHGPGSSSRHVGRAIGAFPPDEEARTGAIFLLGFVGGFRDLCLLDLSSRICVLHHPSPAFR